jgi:hypothetical protein
VDLHSCKDVPVARCFASVSHVLDNCHEVIGFQLKEITLL